MTLLTEPKMGGLEPLTEEQITTYYREGYLVAPNLVPEIEVDRAVEAFGGIPENSTRWTASIFDHDNPDANRDQHRLLIEPHLIGAVEQIFEAPPRVYYGMTAVVPAGGGSGLAWHQDNQYSQILVNALNVFVALCDITPDKAILWVAPRTHRLGTQPSQEGEGRHREAVIEPENGFALPMLKKGDVCLFDRNTYHRSLRNETNEHRYAYAAQFMADYARIAETGAKDPTRMLARDLCSLWSSLRQE